MITQIDTFGQTIFPTGTTIYNPDEAYNSYILISDHTRVGNHPKAKVREAGAEIIPDDIRLIDMNGNVIHTWKVAPYFNKRSRLLPNGHLVYTGPNKTIIEYDWDGNEVWRHEGIGSVNDLRVLPNNNRLLVAHEPIPEEYQKKVKDVEIAPWWGLRKRGSKEKQLSADLYEINLKGEVVWEWHAYNHLDLNRFSPATPEGDWLHVNSIAPIPENKWNDAGDQRFKPGNIILNARNIDTIYIIDKKTKKVVWEGTHTYKGGMAHCHESEMIEKGLPGAGNIIFFDNGLFTRHRTHTGQTFVMEMNPVTKEIVWIYETEGYANLKFFSKSMGTQKRLPNGNTFISEDNKGRIFQVKPNREIVWEYVNRGGTTRPSPIPYDYTPQLRALPKPDELSVTSPNNLEWHLKPDKFRKNDQSLFPDKCLGGWGGMMHIYNNGTLKDSVQVKFTVAKSLEPNVWTWKTEYLSTKIPVIKDYILRLKDKEKNLYVIDEGEGLELNAYLFGNKFYSVFETHDILLTSSYEFIGDKLVFEVTSGKKLSGDEKEVTNYSVTNLQRVVFKKIE